MEAVGQLTDKFYYTDCLFFGAIISATDPGMAQSLSHGGPACVWGHAIEGCVCVQWRCWPFSTSSTQTGISTPCCSEKVSWTTLWPSCFRRKENRNTSTRFLFLPGGGWNTDVRQLQTPKRRCSTLWLILYHAINQSLFSATLQTFAQRSSVLHYDRLAVHVHHFCEVVVVFIIISGLL